VNFRDALFKIRKVFEDFADLHEIMVSAMFNPQGFDAMNLIWEAGYLTLNLSSVVADVHVRHTFGEGSIRFTFRIPLTGIRKLANIS